MSKQLPPDSDSITAQEILASVLSIIENEISMYMTPDSQTFNAIFADYFGRVDAKFMASIKVKALKHVLSRHSNVWYHNAYTTYVKTLLGSGIQWYYELLRNNTLYSIISTHLSTNDSYMRVEMEKMLAHWHDIADSLLPDEHKIKNQKSR